MNKMNNQYFVGQPLLGMHASIILGIAGILFPPNRRSKTFPHVQVQSIQQFFHFNKNLLIAI
jgi:hypothetical protein